jgi:hemoglobin/transferrin/lactoferrin receptor protein
VSRPVMVPSLDRPHGDAGSVVTVPVSSLLHEELTVIGAAPTIDATRAGGKARVPREDIHARQPGTLLEVLENVPGVSQVSEGHAAVPALRGLANGRTLLVIDGGRVSSERRVGPGANFLDPESLDAVDVARGPGSVAYGSDAFGGVISLRTRRPDPATPLRVRASGTLTQGGQGSVELSKGLPAGGMLVQAHARHADDYGSPSGTVFNSGWEDRGLLARVSQDIAGGLLSVGLQSDEATDVGRPRNNSRTVRFSYPFERSHRVTASFERPRAGAFSNVQVAGLFDTYEQRTDQDRYATTTTGRSIERADISFRDFGVRATAARVIRSARLEFGADVHRRFALHARDATLAFALDGSLASERRSESVADASRLGTGLFVQGEAAPHRRLLIGAGVRGDRVTTESRGGYFGDRATSHVAPSGFGSVTVGPFVRTTVTAQVSRGFRDPVLSDRYYRGPSGRGFITGNPDLDPETSLQFDLAIRNTSGRVRSAVYLYQYRIDDLVERYQSEPDFFFFRNRGRARLRGIEAEVQADLGGGISSSVGAHIQHGVALDDQAALDGIPPPTLMASLTKRWSATGRVYLRTALFADDHRPGPTEQRIAGYSLVDAGASWRVHRSLELRGLIRNALNAQYLASPDTRAVSAPGSTASITAVFAIDQWN